MVERVVASYKTTRETKEKIREYAKQRGLNLGEALDEIVNASANLANGVVVPAEYDESGNLILRVKKLATVDVKNGPLEVKVKPKRKKAKKK